MITFAEFDITKITNDEFHAVLFFTILLTVLSNPVRYIVKCLQHRFRFRIYEIKIEFPQDLYNSLVYNKVKSF